MLQKISYAQIDHDDDLRNIYDIKPLIRRLIWLLKSGCDKKHTCPLCGKVAISNEEIEKNSDSEFAGIRKGRKAGAVHAEARNNAD